MRLRAQNSGTCSFQPISCFLHLCIVRSRRHLWPRGDIWWTESIQRQKHFSSSHDEIWPTRRWRICCRGKEQQRLLGNIMDLNPMLVGNLIKTVNASLSCSITPCKYFSLVGCQQMQKMTAKKWCVWRTVAVSAELTDGHIAFNGMIINDHNKSQPVSHCQMLNVNVILLSFHQQSLNTALTLHLLSCEHNTNSNYDQISLTCCTTYHACLLESTFWI